MAYCPDCGAAQPEAVVAPTAPPLPERTWTFDPITVNGAEIDSMTLRAPSFQQFKIAMSKRFDAKGLSAPNSEVLVMEKMVQLVSGLDMTVVNLLPGHIVADGSEYCMSFFQKVL